MKTPNHIFLLMFLFILQVCGCKTVDLTPRETIACDASDNYTNHDLSHRYQAVLDKYIGKGFPGFTAAIYTPEEGLWLGAVGLSDIKNQVAMATCNVSYSGSVAKLYTVTAAMKLYEDGMLDLNAPIANHLPTALVDRLPNAKTATIRQLMNHTAGMPDHDDDEALSDYVDDHDGGLPSPIDQLLYLADDAPRFAPGDSVAYSSAHTVALAMIVDQISGSSHADVISRDIIQPLGLNNTYYKNERNYPRPDYLVKGYLGKAKKDKDISQESINYCNGSHGDAGLIASAEDYLTFLKALMEGKIVSQSTLDLMLTPEWWVQDAKYGLGLGLGLFIMKTDGVVDKVGHGGETIGGMSHLYYYPTEGAYISLLTNTIIEDDPQFGLLWAGGTIVGTGVESVIDDLETVIFE